MKTSIPVRKLTLICFFLLIIPLAGAQLSNLEACKYGYASCDLAQLTGNEQAQVAVAAHARNFDACRYGYASCNLAQLTANEQAQVAVAAHVRNFDACRYGYASCDLAQLTANEQAQVAASPPTQRVPLPTTSGTGLCAENGSCYGDPNINGVPKTVHVNGYYRRDGTYVRGHYRSAPGTNPRKR